MSENERKNEANGESRESYLAVQVAIIFVAAGIGVLVLARHVAKIEGDGVLVALLLIPIVIYLAMMGKLKGFTLGPLSANFIESKVEDIKKKVEDKVNEVGQYEEERSTYLGKLSQILNKTSRFCLIYADIDDLRQHSREIFLHEQQKPFAKRRLEHKIREEIIDKLDFALADAFCGEGIKHDMFDLTEPDVVLIAREVNLEQARSAAEQAQKNFKDYTSNPKVKGYTATIAIVSSDEEKRPRELDKIALERLSRGKKHGKSEIYSVTLL